MALIKGNHKWLVTGCAGFIGSHLVEYLLKNNQTVIGIDNFATGFQKNIDDVLSQVENPNFKFLKVDLSKKEIFDALEKFEFDYILHQGALGSVPRSIKDPLNSHQSNVDGFIHMLEIAREKEVKKFVYASSSSVYGDHPDLPKEEDKVGSVLSPYAATKKINEVYAGVYAHSYELASIGLRYFNVFGRRQDPDGAYAAVIPKWTAAFLKNEKVYINGDGETSRDFCYIENVIQANIKSAISETTGHEVLNIACHAQTTLNELKDLLIFFLREKGHESQSEIEYRDFRPGDVRHSLANVDKARNLIGYNPTHSIKEGLAEAIEWYIKNVS